MNNNFNSQLISNEEIDKIKNKIINTIWEENETRFVRASLLLTEDCNLNCSYCFENSSRNKNKMSAKVAIASVEYLIKGAKLNNEKAISLTFFGGEPTLNIPIMELAFDYAFFRTNEENLQLQCNIITNATIFSEELKIFYKKWYEKLKYLDIQLSIDGMPEIQDTNRPFVGGSPSSKVIEKNIEEYINLFKELKIENNYSLHVHSVINKKSIDKMYENYQYFLNKGLPKIWFMPCHEEEWTDEDVEIYRIEKQKIADYIYEKCLEQNSAEFINSYSSLSKCHTKHPDKPCGMGHNYCTITALGEIYPCHSVYFQDKEMKVGNVLECIDNIEKRRFFLDYTTQNLFGDQPCSDCDNYSCYRCIGQNYASNGNFLIGFPQYCKLSRAEDEIRKNLRKKLAEKDLLPKDNGCNGNCSCGIGNNGEADRKITIKILEELDKKLLNLEENLILLNNKLDGLVEINNILSEVLLNILIEGKNLNE